MTEPPPKRATIKAAVQTVAAFRETTIEAIVSDSRTKRFVQPRREAIFIACEISGKSRTAIGHFFRRDQTTVAYSVARVAADMRNSPAYHREIGAMIEAALNGDAGEEEAEISHLPSFNPEDLEAAIRPTLDKVGEQMRKGLEKLAAAIEKVEAESLRRGTRIEKGLKEIALKLDRRQAAPAAAGGSLRPEELQPLAEARRRLTTAQFSSAEGPARTKVIEEVDRLMKRIQP